MPFVRWASAARLEQEPALSLVYVSLSCSDFFLLYCFSSSSSSSSSFYHKSKAIMSNRNSRPPRQPYGGNIGLSVCRHTSVSFFSSSSRLLTLSPDLLVHVLNRKLLLSSRETAVWRKYRSFRESKSCLSIIRHICLLINDPRHHPP